MSSKYGINVTFENKGASSYSVDASTPIAIVGDDKTLRGLSVYQNVDEALRAVGDGSLKNALKDLEATGLNVQIILSAFEKQSGKNENVLNAIKLLKKSEQELKLKPKFILAPEYNEAGVWEALKGVATSLRAIYAIELTNTTENEIKTELESINTHRAIISFQKVTRSDNTTRPASAFLIALYAKVMASSDYGFAQSYSNRVIDGIIGVVDSIEYLQGEDCEADRLRGMGVTCILVDNGIRAWGRGTRDTTLGLSSIHSVVIFDRIIETILSSQKEAIDKSMSDYLKKVKDDLDAFYRKLQANKVIIDFKISLDEDLNTNEAIAEGEIYITQKVQEMPLISKITNKIYRVTEYGTELIKQI